MNRHTFQSFGEQCMICGNGFDDPLHMASAGARIPQESFSGPDRPQTAEERLREALSLVSELTEQSRVLRAQRDELAKVAFKGKAHIEQLARMVNMSNPGKVRAEDFTEALSAALAKARSNEPQANLSQGA